MFIAREALTAIGAKHHGYSGVLRAAENGIGEKMQSTQSGTGEERPTSNKVKRASTG